jgi:O-Antigen ligase
MIQASIVAAIVAGCALLSARPSVSAAAATTFILSSVAARFWFRVTHTVILLLAYTSTGVMLAWLPVFPAGSLWLTALAGVIVGGLPWTRWRAPAEWRWPLMLWLLGVAISWPIVALRETDFTLAAPSDGVGPVVLGALANLCTGLWLDTALSWDLQTIERRVARPLAIGVIVAAMVVLYQGFVDITWMSGEPWISARRAPGLMGDANPMAVVAALWAPLAGLVLAGDRNPRLFAVVSAAFLWSAAWLTGARSVILLIAAGGAGLVIGTLLERVHSKRRVALLLGGAAVVAIVIGVVVAARAPATGPIGRLRQSLPLDRPGALAYEVLWRRDGYGLAAARAIREEPLSGVGIGAFNFLSPYYYRLEGGPSVLPDNAQNLWRHALAERGLFGFVSVLVLTVLIVRLVWQPATRVPPLYAWCLKGTLLGLGLALLFGLPIQDPAVAITAALLVAWLRAAGANEQPVVTLRSGAVAAVWILAVAGATVDAWSARRDLRPAWRATRVGDLYAYGFGDIEAGPNGVTGRPLTGHGVMAFRATGPRFALRCWARGTTPQRLRVWADRRLVLDEALPAGIVHERLINAPSDRPGMLFEFETVEPGIGVAGEFVNR